MSLMCNSHNHCNTPTRNQAMARTAAAINIVATTEAEARMLVVIAFSETGFYLNHPAFGALALFRRHPNATVEDLARAALRSVSVGHQCGNTFFNWMVMYIDGGCSPNRETLIEARRRQRMLHRLESASISILPTISIQAVNP